MFKLLNGKELADKVKDEVRAEVSKMESYGQSVRLAVIQVGNNPASETYVKNKQNACNYCGIISSTYKLPETVSEDEVIELIEELNHDDDINGILVQLPLPEHFNEDRIIQAVAVEKDVDGFNEANVGRLMIGADTFVPCTAKGIIELLVENCIEIAGKNCVVVGRSNIVGKPTAMELLRHNGTVTICHSKTKNLKEMCKNADILVCAIGKPKFFNKEYIGENAVVIDVGIHKLEDGSMCGDVDFEDVKDIVSAITPVPRGVGAMTVAMLMKNCVQAIKMQCQKRG